jgi:uncharacterized protein YoxC
MVNINIFYYINMFKNLFKSTNVKKMEDQIAQLREDVTSLQAQIKELINKQTLNNVQPTLDNVLMSTLDNILEPRIEKEELIAVVIDPASILENPTIHGLESLIMKEPFDLLDNIVEKVLDKVENVVDDVSNKVENVVDEVLDKVENVVDDVSNKVENVVDEVLDKVENVVDQVLDQVSTKVENVAEKVLEQVPTVEKETNTVTPKKRRQSKKATQLEDALPKFTV